MKKNDVQIGATYLVKVASSIVPVKITREHDNGGWEGTSVKTGKAIRIKSPQRLRGLAPDCEAKQRALAVAEAQAADAAANAYAVPAEPTAPAKTNPEKEPKTRKPSGLDAAHQVLLAAGQPMRCGDIVEQIINTGLWETNGKTPAATIYAAILREITTKGDASRFRKTDRGLFAANG